MQDRDGGEQRRAQRVAEHERPPRAERGDDRAAGDAERERGQRPAGEDERPSSVDPVVASTNHGSATVVMFVPVRETEAGDDDGEWSRRIRRRYNKMDVLLCKVRRCRR